MILRYSCRIIATCGNCGNVLAIHRRYGQLDTGGCGDTLSVAPTMRCWSSAMSRPSAMGRAKQAAADFKGLPTARPRCTLAGPALAVLCVLAGVFAGDAAARHPARLAQDGGAGPAPSLIVRFDDGQAQALASHCADKRSGSATPHANSPRHDRIPAAEILAHPAA